MRVKKESKQDLAKALHPRYLRATRQEKGRLLDEFVEVTGYHRNYAKQILLHGPAATPTGRLGPRTGTPRYAGGRPSVYGSRVIQALYVAAEATGWICGKRLVAALPQLVPALEQEGALSLFTSERTALLNMSAATIDRKLARERAQHNPAQAQRSMHHQARYAVALSGADPHLHSLERAAARLLGNRPGGSLWREHGGHLPIYLCTLNAVDVATGWTECVAVANKGQGAVFAALQLMRERLPFPLLGLDSDNGGEFINDHLIRYCQRERITFTRCRPYRKNDQAHVEQKNGSVVRQLVGYDRYTTPAALAQLGCVYELVRLHVNAYLPVMKLVGLVGKERTGSRVHKHYDVPTTPYKRALAAGVLSLQAQSHFQAQLRAAGPGPLSLRHQLLAELDKLWTFCSVQQHSVLRQRLPFSQV